MLITNPLQNCSKSQKQQEEADYLVIIKIDLLSPNELVCLKTEVASAWPDIKMLEISALKNIGVLEWISTVSAMADSGQKVIEVDYDLYAKGEAELGWLNASVSLIELKPANWDVFARRIMEQIRNELASLSAEIGHLKILLSNSSGQIVANLTDNSEKPAIKNNIGESAGTASLILNARVHLEPGILKSIVERSIETVAGQEIQIAQVSLSSFNPAYPKPTYRIDDF
jgi:hypothetical protein